LYFTYTWPVWLIDVSAKSGGTIKLFPSFCLGTTYVSLTSTQHIMMTRVSVVVYENRKIKQNTLIILILLWRIYNYWYLNILKVDNHSLSCLFYQFLKCLITVDEILCIRKNCLSSILYVIRICKIWIQWYALWLAIFTIYLPIFMYLYCYQHWFKNQ